jgi:hypothetical protein
LIWVNAGSTNYAPFNQERSQKIPKEDIKEDIMGKEDLSNQSSNKIAPPFFISMNFLEMNKKWLDPLMGAQTEFLRELQEKWLSRMSTEANLTSEFASKLGAARSMPDVAAAYQDWLQQHMQKFAEDSREFVSNGQKLMQASTQAFSNGRPSSFS